MTLTFDYNYYAIQCFSQRQSESIVSHRVTTSQVRRVDILSLTLHSNVIIRNMQVNLDTQASSNHHHRHSFPSLVTEGRP